MSKNASKDAESRVRGRPVKNTVSSNYQPSKSELEADISLPVTPERLARAVVAGGAPRRKAK